MAPIADEDFIYDDGFSTSGKEVTKRRLSEGDIESGATQTPSRDHDLVPRTFHLLIADLCQPCKGTHLGGAICTAAIGVALWKYAMKYAGT